MVIKKFLTLGSIFAGLLVGGCSTVNIDPSSFENELQLPVSASNPSPKGSVSSKVVIFDVNAEHSPTAAQAQAGSPIQFALDGYINDAGAKLVDRDLAVQLKDEVIRAEMGGAGAYGGAPIADYAVRTNITQASFGASFEEASTWRDDDGEVHRTPPSCNYSSRVAITVDVYTVPELTRVRSFRGEGSASGSEDARSSTCNANGTNLVRSAAEDAVYEIQEDLKAFFSPVGYVLTGYKTREGDYILKTTLTKEFGAVPGKGVKVITVTAEGDRYEVAAGKVGNPVVRSGAFVVIDEEAASKVRIGDEVRIDHSCSFMGCQADQMLGMKL